jgi:signal transduction histidine kinase
MRIRSFSIRRKLIAIIMATSISALFLACAAFAFNDASTFRRTVFRETETLTQILSDASQAALTFNDAKAARETLNFLKAEPRILAGCAYNEGGKLLAVYSRNGSALCPAERSAQDLSESTSQSLVIARPVELQNHSIGSIYLVADLSELKERLMHYLLIAAFVMAASILLALVISSFLQELISKPIVTLAETAGLVSVNQDYTVRAAKLADDEIGNLVERFNEMLDQIQLRDQELQGAHDSLESRVVERTAALQSEIGQHKETQHALLAAKLVAEESNCAKSAFLANMSHELRTPLNAIIGYSEMLQEESDEMSMVQFSADLTKIRAAGRHLLTLINDVLDISKIEAGKTTVAMEEVDLSQLTRDVVSTLEPVANENKNLLLIDSVAEGLVVMADVVRLRQSLLNLVSNACKFTRNGEVRISAEQTNRDDVEWVFLSVHDTGIGIHPDQLSKLFHAFSQIDSSATRRFEGTGLGLAISRRLCRLMGGDISVESEPGRGSTFRIELPLHSQLAPYPGIAALGVALESDGLSHPVQPESLGRSS